MFQQRQLNEIYQLVEVSKTAALSVGAVGNNAVAGPAVVACTIGGSPATFALGDTLEVYAPASAALNGVVLVASPSPTPGSCFITGINSTGGSVTPTASTVYTIVAKRVTPTLI